MPRLATRNLDTARQQFNQQKPQNDASKMRKMAGKREKEDKILKDTRDYLRENPHAKATKKSQISAGLWLVLIAIVGLLAFGVTTYFSSPEAYEDFAKKEMETLAKRAKQLKLEHERKKVEQLAATVSTTELEEEVTARNRLEQDAAEQARGQR